MWRAGLVNKARSPRDQRVVRIRMQPKGEEKLKQAAPAAFGQAGELLNSCLSKSELEQLDKLLKKVRDGALSKLGMDAGPLPDMIELPDSCPP